MTPHSTAEREELKSILRKVKEESQKVGLKLNIKKTKIMASGPITSWKIDGETMKTMRDHLSLFPGQPKGSRQCAAILII